VFENEHLDAADRHGRRYPVAVPPRDSGVQEGRLLPRRSRGCATARISGNLTFSYELWRTDLVFDHAYGEALGKVGEQTSLPVLLGTPEA
jgi:hypothetical protein